MSTRAATATRPLPAAQRARRAHAQVLGDGADQERPERGHAGDWRARRGPSPARAARPACRAGAWCCSPSRTGSGSTRATTSRTAAAPKCPTRASAAVPALRTAAEAARNQSGGRPRRSRVSPIARHHRPRAERGHEQPESVRALVQHVARDERHHHVEVEHEHAHDDEQGQGEGDGRRARRVGERAPEPLPDAEPAGGVGIARACGWRGARRGRRRSSGR